ncbi:hypothetical protein [Polaribacter sp. KT 15]|uniref:hypothetical protein n=1 Tax=Polaribacter sp. KT 15 TaxID=1896175 RepID=UPI0009096CDF|nr:hypothetical protein [Polaribacter sp. KT 15]SHM83606.1 hypothetical protein SAMN05720268_0862 [Polaribacter sp. KT 15]
MKRIIFTVIFTLYFMNIYCQDTYLKLPNVKNTCPIIIIGKDIIGNKSAIESTKEFTAEISVLKDKPNRKKHDFFNLTENGIIFAKLEKKTDFKTQSELNEFFGIKKDNEIYVNGYLIENSKYKIATECIMDIELVEPDSENKLKNKAINVWTITKEQRNNGCEWQNGN